MNVENTKKHQVTILMLFLIADRNGTLVVIPGNTDIPPIIFICLDIVVIQNIRFYCIGKYIGMINGLILVDFLSFIGF